QATLPSQSDIGSTRERRRRSQAAAIELIALKLFAKKGFTEVTVDELADAADISKRTFFRYFASKDDILLGDRKRFAQALAAALKREYADQRIVAALRDTIVKLTREEEANVEATRLRLELFSQSPETMATASQQVQTYQAEVTPIVARRMGLNEHKDLRPALLVGVMMSATFSALTFWLANGAKGPSHKVVATALDQVIEGMGKLDFGARPGGSSAKN
ncbi:MAG: TetR family transcriptional regulator, partial [Caulobacterales bacterium]